MKRSFSGALAALVVTMLCMNGTASGADDPGRLGKDLTASGAPIAGSKDESIPTYAGKEDPLPGWTPGGNRIAFWKHKNEKPSFSIDASNVSKYEDKLTPGQVTLIKTIAGYRMDVYPSRRTCALPDFVLENTRKNAVAAKLAEDGWSLKEAVVPGYPFPFPKKGIEAMWNAKLHYRGVATEYKSLVTVVSPRKGSDGWIKAGMETSVFYPWGTKGSAQWTGAAQAESHSFVTYSSPVALAGQAFLVNVYSGQPMETFYYFPGQRRVRRMPAYAYDAPQIGYENQYTMDEVMMFTGALDRFDWKLAGTKEIFVPYNSFGAQNIDAKPEDAFKPDFLDPALRRYELHRVWVVEATVKPGMRHTTPRRTYYLDEDSWNILLADDFDSQGKLSKSREGYLIPIWELGGACDAAAFGQYNVREGRYLVDFHTIANGKSGGAVYLVDSGNRPKYKPGYYTADNLRALSDR